MVLPLLLAATLTVASPAPAPTPEAAALRVVDAFRVDDVPVLHALAPGVIARVGDWANADAVIDGVECISVPAAEVERVAREGERATVHLRLVGWGTTQGPVKSAEMLPGRWVVGVVRAGDGWAVESVRVAEAVLGVELAALRTDAERRERLDCHPEADVMAVLGFMTDACAEPGEDARRREGIEWALAEARALNDAAAEVTALRMLSVQRLFNGAPGEARAAAAEALALAERAGDPDTIARAWFSSGIAHWFSDDIPAGVQHLRRSADMVDAVRKPVTPLMARAMESHLLQGAGDVSGALTAAFALESRARRYGWLEGELVAVQRLAAILETAGYMDDARYTERCWAIAQRLRRSDLLAVATTQLGGTELTRGAYTRAAELHRDALALDGLRPVDRAVLYGGLAICLDRLGDRSGALAAVNAGMAIEHDDVAARDFLLAYRSEVLLRMGRAEEALASAREAIVAMAAPVRASATTQRGLGHTAEAAALRALGRCDDAAAAYREAIARVEAQRETAGIAAESRVYLFDHRAEAYHGLITLLVEDGRNEEALRVSEMLKARALRDAVAGEKSDAVADPAVAERMQMLEREIARLNLALLASGEVGFREDLRAALADARADLEVLRMLAKPRPAVLESANDPLARPRVLLPDAGGVILDYVVAEEETILFAITREDDALRVEAHRIPVTRKRLTESVSRLVAMLETRDYAYTSAARELYRLLVEPAGKTIAARPVVALLPDGPLWRVPFAVLRDGRDRHFIETAALFSVPSLAWLDAAASRPHAPSPGALVVGDPYVTAKQAAVLRSMTRSVGPLPDAAREARSIAALYTGSRMLLGRQATEEAVKREAGRHGVLHFATHALTETRQPLYSSIVLAHRAEGSADDGLLEAREVLDLSLDAELVVLSACATGRGAVRTGEGLIGLPWAFFMAGTMRTVVAQWEIDSAPSAGIMIDFHRDMQRRGGPGTVAAALRHAQIAAMRTPATAHPYYWGAFGVIGDGWPRVTATSSR
ncbi:MAG TPA: CHAT domain-containing protein [Thermoanaerobaculia bacterium]